MADDDECGSSFMIGPPVLTALEKEVEDAVIFMAGRGLVEENASAEVLQKNDEYKRSLLTFTMAREICFDLLKAEELLRNKGVKLSSLGKVSRAIAEDLVAIFPVTAKVEPVNFVLTESDVAEAVGNVFNDRNKDN